MFHSYNRILSALAVIVSLMLTVTGCGEKSGGVGIDNQAGGEGTLSETADMTGMTSGTDPAELLRSAGVTDDEIPVSDKELARLIYREFVAGERKVEGIGIEDLAAKDDDPHRHYTTKYTVLDVTGDAVPELHVRTFDKYTLLTCRDGKLEMLPFENPFGTPFYLLSDGGYLSLENPGWTNSYWYNYSHFTLDASGSRTTDIRFGWKDNNENLVCDEEDKYYFTEYSDAKGKWVEASCTKEEWLEKTGEYLYTDGNGREQIRGRAEWQLYCEDSNVVEGWGNTCPEVEWEKFDDGYDVLADGLELDPILRKAFLSRYGFGEAAPLYQYNGYYFPRGEDSCLEHRVEFYYDEKRDLACGILYWEKTSGGFFAAGVIVDGTWEDSWEPQDPFSTLSEDGRTGEALAEDYSEECQYDDAGRLLGFRSYGIIHTAEPGQYADAYEPLIEVDFVYDEEGNLREKHSWSNELAFVSFGPMYYQYDERGCLIRSQQFKVHVTDSVYYIYQGDEEEPTYCFKLYGGTVPILTVYR